MQVLPSVKNPHLWRLLVVPNPESLADPDLRRAVQQGDSAEAELVFALAVCNTVVPVSKTGGLSYKVASQDELAFVTAAARLGVTLTTRQGQTLGEAHSRRGNQYCHSGRDCQLDA